MGLVTLAALGLSAGLSAYGAHKQKKATEKATQTQVDANVTAANDTRLSSARALDYINSARNMPGQAPGPAQGYLSNLMGVPGKPAGPAQKPAQLPGGYQTLFGPM